MTKAEILEAIVALEPNTEARANWLKAELQRELEDARARELQRLEAEKRQRRRDALEEHISPEPIPRDGYRASRWLSSVFRVAEAQGRTLLRHREALQDFGFEAARVQALLEAYDSGEPIDGGEPVSVDEVLNSVRPLLMKLCWYPQKMDSLEEDMRTHLTDLGVSKEGQP